MKRGAYPFQKCDGNVKWKTYHFVPHSLESALHVESSSNENMFDIPVNSEYFINLLGDRLISSAGGSNEVSISTTDALINSRLVAFYFSAHWCGPCRQFTPMLSEMYETLKDANPSHGLEVVFVSSDHDGASFENYFQTMPWMALPFTERAKKKVLSQQ